MPGSTVLQQELRDAMLALQDAVQKRQDGMPVLRRAVRELQNGWPVPVLPPVSDSCCHWRSPDWP
jgi:hypothetical protein